MTDDHPLDDDELLAMLAEAIERSDPVPQHVLDAAKAVPELAGLDAELAQLTFDSDRELAGVRSAGTGRQLSFEAGPIDLELVVHTEMAAGRRVVVIEGQVAPADVVEGSLVSADPFSRPVVAVSDDLGRFRFGDAPVGAIRLVVRTDDAQMVARPVVTTWFRP